MQAGGKSGVSPSAVCTVQYAVCNDIFPDEAHGDGNLKDYTQQAQAELSCLLLEFTPQNFKTSTLLDQKKLRL